MLYASKDGEVLGKAPAPNHEWATNKTAIGCLIIEDARDLELGQIKEQGGSLVAKSADDLLAQAKVAADIECDDNFQRFVERKPDGRQRYSSVFLLDIKDAKDQYTAAGVPLPAPIAALVTWQGAIKSGLAGLKAAIANAASLAELAALDWSYGWFEARYGVAGGASPDPDVRLADLI